MPYATRDGVTLRYELMGTGAPPFVLVHGWSGDHTVFDPLVAHFKSTTRVVTMDLRGCGGSSAPPHGYDIGTLADDVTWLCRHLDIDGPVLVGHSLGAAIAIELGSRHPELPSAIVALDPAPIDALPATRHRFEDLLRELEGPAGDEARRSFMEDMFLPTDDSHQRSELIRIASSSPLHAAAQMLRGLLTWNGPVAIRQCAPPLLIVTSEPGGSNDPTRILPFAPDVLFGITVGSGHFIPLEVPEQVIPMIERFIRLQTQATTA